MRTIAKGLKEAKIMQNTEENQAFVGIENLSHNLEVVGSNPAPAIFSIPNGFQTSG